MCLPRCLSGVPDPIMAPVSPAQTSSHSPDSNTSTMMRGIYKSDSETSKFPYHTQWGPIPPRQQIPPPARPMFPSTPGPVGYTQKLSALSHSSPSDDPVKWHPPLPHAREYLQLTLFRGAVGALKVTTRWRPCGSLKLDYSTSSRIDKDGCTIRLMNTVGEH